MREVLTTLLLSVCAGTNAYADTIVHASAPTGAGIVVNTQTQRTDPTSGTVGAISEPGCSWALLYQGIEPETGGWGAADLETGRLNGVDTVFNIASISKQFTALAVLLLARDAQLDLDQAVMHYLPQLDKELGKPTLRQLLRHTSGMPDYIDPLIDAGRETEAVTAVETLELVAGQHHLHFEPGSRFEYSNTGYFLLAQVVEHVSGQSLASFSRQYIFKPLGMPYTLIVDHYPSGINKLARGYQVKAGQTHINEPTWEQTGDGQVHTNASDMLQWLRRLDSNTPMTTPAGKQTAGILSLLTSDTEPVVDADTRKSYWNGLEAMKLGEQITWAHSGGWGGYRSFMAYAPASHRGVVIMCNTTGANLKRMAAQMLDGRLQALP
ncbi:beta-lactamase family protein [Allopusillimonas ginsengisoli]|nr:beta-lactamase family protein [Allopusillimonas ginsengisoli]